MVALETAPGRWETLEDSTPNLPPGGPFTANTTPLSVQEAADAGDYDALERAVVRETIGQLTDPYIDSMTLMGVMPLDSRGGLGNWQQGGTDLSNQERTQELALSRRLSVFSPPAHHTVKMHAAYVVGQGIPKPTATDSDVQAVIDDFWEDPDNAELCTFAGQSETDCSLQVNGELFVAFFVSEDDGHVKCRTIDALDVVDVVTDPDDRKRPLYYRVRLHDDRYDFARGEPSAQNTQTTQSTDRYVYFPDWQNTDPKRDPYHGEAAPLAKGGAVLGHWALNRLGLRGIPDSAAAAPWVAQHKKFMGERAILQAAAAKIAFIKTVKGGPAQVNAAMALEETSLSGAISGLETNPAWAPGSTYVHNAGIDLEQFKFDTMAGNAAQDGEMLAQMFSTAFGFPTYYTLMSTHSTRLATAVAMELPVLKLMLAMQQMWKDMLRAILDFALVHAAIAGRLKVPTRVAHGRTMIDWKKAPPAPKDEATPPAGSPPSPDATQTTAVREMDPASVEAQAAHIDKRAQPDATKEQSQKQRGQYKVDMPPLLERETQALVAAIVQAGQAGYITPEQAAYQIMLTLGFAEVDDEIDQWRAYILQHADILDKHAEEAKQQAMGAGKGPTGNGAAGKPPEPKTPATTAGAGLPSGGMSGDKVG
jgi:hypothetical protein